MVVNVFGLSLLHNVKEVFNISCKKFMVAIVHALHNDIWLVGTVFELVEEGVAHPEGVNI